MKGLLNISNEEWLKAEAFFSKRNESKIKMFFSKNKTKMKKTKSAGEDHSFIKVGNEIFALANRHCYGEDKHALLGEGAFGKVKVVQSKNGENFAVKIEGRGLRGDKNAETKITKALGFTKGETVHKLDRGKIYKGEYTTQKLYTVMELKEGKELRKHIYLPRSSPQKPFIV